MVRKVYCTPRINNYIEDKATRIVFQLENFMSFWLEFECFYMYVLYTEAGFWTLHGAEELSGVNSSPAQAAGQVVGKT